jgi:TRAP-type C4-dicarboxylate transport system permease small subunit
MSVICGVFVVVLALDVTAEVFTRYVLNKAFTGAMEIAQMAFVWSALLGGVIALAANAHLVVDLVSRHFPRRAKPVINIFLQFLMLAFSVVLVWQGYIYWLQAAVGHWTWGELEYPMALTRSAVPVSGILFFIVIAVQIYNSFRSLRS